LGATLAWHAALMRPNRFTGVVALSVPMMAQPPVRPTMIFPQTEEALFYILYFQTPGIAEQELERDVSVTLRKIYFALSADNTAGTFNMMVPRGDGLLATMSESASLSAWLTGDDLRICVDASKKSGFRGPLNYYRNMDRNFELTANLKGLKVCEGVL
jgi:hypothetical protein